MPRKPSRRRRGQGSIYQPPGSAFWWIKWRLPTGERRSAKFPTKDLAERVLAVKLGDAAARREGLAPDVRNLPTLGEIADDWIERREKAGTVRSWRDDRSRWNAHLKATFGARKPPEVDVAAIRRFVETKLAAGLASTSVKHLIATLSNVYADAIEQGHATTNPARQLPRSLRRMLRPSHDPRTTPYLARQEDVARVCRVLAQPWATLYAVTALAGLRPGEALALEWSDLDLAGGRVLVQRQVRHGRVGPPKSGKPRPVPILPALGKLLAEYKLATGGAGRLFPAQNAARGGERGEPGKFLDPAVMQRKLADALKACGLPAMTWYSAGRHTFASQHVLAGKSLAKLREILGHSTVVVTERYAHLSPAAFREDDLMTFAHDLRGGDARVIDLGAARDEQRASVDSPVALATTAPR